MNEKRRCSMKRKLVLLFTIMVMVVNVLGKTVNADGSLIPISGAVLNDQLNFRLDSTAVVPVGDDGTPVLPISYNGTTYLPVRAIGYLLGLGIDYDGPTKTVLISRTTSSVAPTAIGTAKSHKLIPISNVVLNGQLKFKLDHVAAIPVGDDGTPVLPISYNGTTYLPIRAIGYLLGLGINYDGATKTVLITKSGTAQTPVTTPTQIGGWYFVKYAFSDGTGTYGSDVSSFTGGKNNMIMSHTRYDDKGKVIASSTHQTSWSDPPNYLRVGDLVSVNYETKQMASNAWTMASLQQQSVSIDQGWTVYLAAPDGTKYITKDFKGVLTAEKALEKGTKGAMRTIRFVIGRNYSVTYTYEWRD